MSSAITIADSILRIAKRQGKQLTPLQLMKLVYIAHGWSLAVRNIDLFNDRIEAWKYGPVIPNLYQATKKFGRNHIPLNFIDDGPASVDSETLNFLEKVYDKYKNFDGIALSSLTHKSGSPWEQVYSEGVMGLEINDNLIRDHYRKLVNVQSRNPAH